MFFQQCDSAEKLQQMHAFAAFKTAANSATLEGDKKKQCYFWSASVLKISQTKKQQTLSDSDTVETQASSGSVRICVITSSISHEHLFFFSATRWKSFAKPIKCSQRIGFHNDTQRYFSMIRLYGVDENFAENYH